MTNDAAQFNEDFGAVPIRATPAPPSDRSALPLDPPFEKGGQGGFALSADDLGALLCRIPYTNLATGEEGQIILNAADWQRLLDRHHLTITRRTP